ncbi:hypothetical protein GCM10023143_01630 [Compostibacter hankyongensis]|uniref:PKD domain-containing protein n=1 Tax=Compostibacter hankyongensis TaxID=1007089 RepID=A0ABP8FCU5_9BACT
MLVLTLRGQQCTNIGQTPGSAFPVCGTKAFVQKSVPPCGGRDIPVPGCSRQGADYRDLNPYWYKFTCYKAGQLQLTIHPKASATDDYDWQVFDITGRNPEDVYTDPSLVVVGNWSQYPGETGASLRFGSAYMECAGEHPQFSKAPELEQGHTYLLLVSHYSGSTQSGYTLDFIGTTADINDPTTPALGDAEISSCDGTKITVQLTKAVACESLAPDGSDFTINGTLAKIKAAAGNNCGNGFDLTAVTLTLDRALEEGSYTLSVKKGSDGNTLLDNCGNAVKTGENTAPFSFRKAQPTPMGKPGPIGCAPQELRLTFAKGIRCSSIAANGSDFTVSGGAQPVTVSGAAGLDCKEGVSKTVVVKLSSPIVHAGTYTVTLKRGSDGNTVIDECGEQTPEDSRSFTAADTVSAVFTVTPEPDCNITTIRLHHPGGNQVDSWNWTLGDGTRSTRQDVVYTDTTFDTQHIRLQVSNGVCSDVSDQYVPMNTDYLIRAAFEAPDILCPEDKAAFKNNSIGNINSWAWDFGDGARSALRSPEDQQYPVPVVKEQPYTVTLHVENNLGCSAEARQTIRVLNNCYIAVPSAFTPNGDGMNDYLYPLNAYKADNLEFRVYNRYGELVFETKDWTRKWDGRVKGVPQGTGAYVWMLQFINRDTGEKVFQKGSTLLIR